VEDEAFPRRLGCLLGSRRAPSLYQRAFAAMCAEPKCRAADARFAAQQQRWAWSSV
jgi:hypothetical protein